MWTSKWTLAGPSSIVWITSRFGSAAFSRIVYCGIFVRSGEAPSAADQNATVSSATAAGTSMLMVFSRFRVMAGSFGSRRDQAPTPPSTEMTSPVR